MSLSLLCSTTTLYHLQDSLKLSPSATALLNIGDLSYAGVPPGLLTRDSSSHECLQAAADCAAVQRQLVTARQAEAQGVLKAVAAWLCR